LLFFVERGFFTVKQLELA